MQKKIRGIILFIKVYKENDLLIKLLSDSDEIITGIVYGGLSKKKRNIFQLGFFLNFNILTNSNKPPNISGELTNPFFSEILDNRYKLNGLLSTISIINLSILEGQKINNIFEITEDFLTSMLHKKNWVYEYCVFLFNLLKIIGYQIDYSKKNNFQYFDLNTLEFTNINNNNTCSFPHAIFENKKVTKNNYKFIIDSLTIFETVFFKHHLANYNLQLPNHYQLFKNTIIDYINSNE